MSTPTARLGMTKFAGSEHPSVTLLNDNSDKADAAVGFQVVTSSTRPSSPYPGKAITESDTSWRSYFHNGTAWLELPNSSGTFGSDLKLASANKLLIGTDVNLYRSAADTLKTDDSLTVAGNQVVAGTASVTGAFTASSSAAVTGNLTVGGDLTVSGVGQTRWIQKAALESVNNTAVLQDDDHLTATVEAAATYEVEFWALFQTAVAGDVTTDWGVPAGATGLKACVGASNTAASFTDRQDTRVRIAGHGFATDVDYQLDADNVAQLCWERGLVTTTSAGSVTFRWAQTLATAGALTLATGSFMKITRIA